jgi:hypothetical protein
MYASKYVFSRSFFSAWIVVSIVWLWATLFIAGFFPIIDGRAQLFQIWNALRKPVSQSETKVESSGSSQLVAEDPIIVTPEKP